MVEDGAERLEESEGFDVKLCVLETSEAVLTESHQHDCPNLS